jgi:hypothetical protein
MANRRSVYGRNIYEPVFEVSGTKKVLESKDE